MQSSAPLSPTRPDQDDRAAMRAFLQRSEGRLSTMHSIAGAFISGAGLLVLVPILLRDALQTYFGLAETQFSIGLLHAAWWDLLWLVPLMCAAVLPVVALYLTIRQLVYLYYRPYVHGVKAQFPVFQPPALSFAIDEPTRRTDANDSISNAKQVVINAIYHAEAIKYVVPEDQNDRLREFMDLLDEREIFERATPDYRKNHKADAADVFNVALGMAGVVDRDLAGEVAMAEAMMVRLNVGLRVLMIRYAKALLISILTVVILLIGAPFIALLPTKLPLPQYQGDSFAVLMPFIVGLGWISLTPIVTHWPVRWIWSTGDHRLHNLAMRRDPQLRHFEEFVIGACIISLFFVVLGISMFCWNYRTLDFWVFFAWALTFVALGSVVMRTMHHMREM